MTIQMTPYEQALQRCTHLSDDTKQHWFEILDTIDELQFHRTIAHSQNECYKQDIKRCQTTTGQMLVVNDWKENYTMKGGTIATGRDFYHTVQVSVMGVIIFCKDIENGKAQKVPIVSNVLTHDGTTSNEYRYGNQTHTIPLSFCFRNVAINKFLV